MRSGVVPSDMIVSRSSVTVQFRIAAYDVSLTPSWMTRVTSSSS